MSRWRVSCGQVHRGEPGQAAAGPEAPWGLDPLTAQEGADGILGAGPLPHELAPMFDHPAPRLGRSGGHVDRRHFIQEQQLGQFLSVDPVVLALRAEDQAQVPRMGHDDAAGDLPQPFEEHTIAAGGFEADGNGRGQPLEFAKHRGPRPFDGPRHDLAPPVIQDTEGRLSQVSIQTDVPHGKPPLGSSPVAGYATSGLLHRFTFAREFSPSSLARGLLPSTVTFKPTPKKDMTLFSVYGILLACLRAGWRGSSKIPCWIPRCDS